ncbi:hypothetical protein ACQ86N_46645 [Puia sp. P3]|uniref:hypothetical protein n=1 Tax=Puia sp. P3 TaxID=3423952 RepID=UPI003D66AC10
MKHRKSISHLGQIGINNSRQRLPVRGRNIGAPQLIHDQTDPGLPMISVAPLSKGRESYDQLQVAEKTFTVFERSAHMPHYEESEKFSATILSILA